MSSSTPVADIFAALPAELAAYTPMTGSVLADFVEREQARAADQMFQATPREQLAEISLWQRIQDVALAGQLRAIARTVHAAPEQQREFVADEVALCVNAGWMTGDNLVTLALRVDELPGLVESLEAGNLTARHVRAVVDVLHEVALTLEQRRAIVVVLLARFAGQTPGELLRVARRLITAVDLNAAKRRKDEAKLDRQVNTAAHRDGQGSLGAYGPMEAITAMRAAINAGLASAPADPNDSRTKDQREFDMLVDLVCGKVERGNWQVQVIVPYSTAAGGDLELAEIPGFGAVLPSTARDLTDLAAALTQVAVDATTGQVLGVSDSVPVRPAPATDAPAARYSAAKAASDRVDPVGGALDRLLSKPMHRDPETLSYRATRRLERLLEARDRTCVFPGCHVPAQRTDKDHRMPWPRGRTSAAEMQCLCRRHHRAKQASFRVRKTEQGGYAWTTRGGWVFTRTPVGY